MSFYLPNDEHVLFHISQYCNHEQICKWTQVCSSLRKFVKSYLPEYFEIDPSKDYKSEWERHCSNGNVKTLQYLVSKRINFGFSEGAIKNAQWEVVKYTIQFSTLTTFTGLEEYKIKAFVGASKCGNLEMVKYLFDIEKVYKKRDIIYEALCKAIKYGHLNVIQFLFPHCINKNYPFISNHISKVDKMEILKYFISQGYHLDYIDIQGACLCGHLHVVQFVVEQGKSIANKSLLLNACLSNNLELIKYLISQGVVIDEPNDILNNVCICCNIEILQYLVSQGLNIQNKVETILSKSCRNYDLSIFTHFATPQHLSLYGGKYLLSACEEGNMNLIKYLFSQGVKPIQKFPQNVWDTKVETCLTLAMENLNDANIIYLIENNLDPFATLDQLLELALYFFRFPLIPYLISKGAKIKWDDNIIFELYDKNVNIVESILSQGVDVNSHDGFLIKTAIQNGDLERVKFLVSKGANIEKESLLHEAIKNGHLNIVKYIFQNFYIPKCHYPNIILKSFSNHHLDVVEYLTSCGLELNTNFVLK